MDPPRKPQRLLDEVERARQSALGRNRGSLSRRMPTSPAWRGMPSYRPPAPPGAAAPPPGGAAPPPGAAAPPAEEEEDDDFDWSDDGEEGCGLQIQEAMEASFQSVRDYPVQRAKTSYQLKANEASDLDWALKDSSSMDLALRRKRARENRAAAHGAGSSRRSP